MFRKMKNIVKLSGSLLLLHIQFRPKVERLVPVHHIGVERERTAAGHRDLVVPLEVLKVVQYFLYHLRYAVPSFVCPDFF